MNEISIKVSVILPVYNSQNTIADAVRSILGQSYRNFELIVIDDGSTDNSVELILQLQDDRIVLISNISNKGISFSLNSAIKQATGQYIARMDADDIAFSTRLQKQVDYLFSHPNVDLVGCSHMIFDDSLQVLGVMNAPTSHNKITKSPWRGVSVSHPTWMVRKSFYEDNLYDSQFDKAEDQHLLLRSMEDKVFANLPETLLAYRVNNRNFSKLFRGRLRFFEAAKEAFIFRKQFVYLALLSLTTLAKIAVDFVDINLRMNLFRTRLSKPSDLLINQWRVLLREGNFGDKKLTK